MDMNGVKPVIYHGHIGAVTKPDGSIIRAVHVWLYDDNGAHDLCIYDNTELKKVLMARGQHYPQFYDAATYDAMTAAARAACDAKALVSITTIHFIIVGIDAVVDAVVDSEP